MQFTIYYILLFKKKLILGSGFGSFREAKSKRAINFTKQPKAIYLFSLEPTKPHKNFSASND